MWVTLSVDSLITRSVDSPRRSYKELEFCLLEVNNDAFNWLSGRPTHTSMSTAGPLPPAPNSQTGDRKDIIPFLNSIVPTLFVGNCYVPIPRGRGPQTPEALIMAAQLGFPMKGVQSDWFEKVCKHTDPVSAFTVMQGLSDETGSRRLMVAQKDAAKELARGKIRLVRSSTSHLDPTAKGGYRPSLDYSAKRVLNPLESLGRQTPPQLAALPLITAFNLLRNLPKKFLFLSDAPAHKRNHRNTPVSLLGADTAQGIQVYTIPGVKFTVNLSEDGNAASPVEFTPAFISPQQLEKSLKKIRRQYCTFRLRLNRLRRMALCHRLEMTAAMLLARGGARGPPGGGGGSTSMPGFGNDDDDDVSAEPPEMEAMVQEMLQEEMLQDGGSLVGGQPGFPENSNPNTSSQGVVPRVAATIACGAVSLVARLWAAAGNVSDAVVMATPLGPHVLGVRAMPNAEAIPLITLMNQLSMYNVVMKSTWADRPDPDYDKKAATAALLLGAGYMFMMQHIIIPRKLEDVMVANIMTDISVDKSQVDAILARTLAGMEHKGLQTQFPPSEGSIQAQMLKYKAPGLYVEGDFGIDMSDIVSTSDSNIFKPEGNDEKVEPIAKGVVLFGDVSEEGSMVLAIDDGIKLVL